MTSDTICNAAIVRPTNQSSTTGFKQESHKPQPDSTILSCPHPNSNESLDSSNSKHVVRKYQSQGNSLGTSSDNNASRTRLTSLAQLDQKHATNQEIPEITTRKDRPPKKLPLGSKDVSAVNGRK
jgi:hypothetical protein